MKKEEAEKRLLILSEDTLWKMHQVEIECPHCGEPIAFENETYGDGDYFVVYGKDREEIETIKNTLQEGSRDDVVFLRDIDYSQAEREIANYLESASEKKYISDIIYDLKLDLETVLKVLDTLEEKPC